MTAEKSWSARPSDFATLYSSFAAAAVGMGWDTDSARASASLRSCHVSAKFLLTVRLRRGATCNFLFQCSAYLLLMFQGKGSRVCSFNHGRALEGEHGSIDSTLWNNLLDDPGLDKKTVFTYFRLLLVSAELPRRQYSGLTPLFHLGVALLQMRPSCCSVSPQRSVKPKIWWSPWP